MTYQEFLEYIYKRHAGNIKLGLERIEAILRELDNPQSKLRGVHVAGSNGKGSTCAMLEALGKTNFYTTGFNSSPHLVDYTERFRLSGDRVDYKKVMQLYLQHQDVFERNEASFFETTTALAFLLFAQEKIQFNIFEVGLGGRLDGTNPFIPDVSVITSISFDHVKSLGNSLEKIAYEKAGIIKEGVPVVVGKVPAEALAVIEEVAESKNAPLYRLGKEFFVDKVSPNARGTSFFYSFYDGISARYTTNLLGEHQAYNAACALTAFSLFENKQGRPLNFYQLHEGLNSVDWQGRMQIVAENPTILLDGAHNEEGMGSLVKSLKEIYPDRKIIFITSILRDKNLEKMYELIASLAKCIVFCQNSSERAAGGPLQEEIISKLTKSYYYEHSVAEALDRAKSLACEDELIVVCGSLYWIGEVLSYLS